jgi:hypothetical protein
VISGLLLSINSCEYLCFNHCNKKFQNSTYRVQFPSDWEQGWTLGKEGYFFRKIDYTLGFGRVELPPTAHFFITITDSLEKDLILDSELIENELIKDSVFINEKHISNRSVHYKGYKASEYTYSAIYSLEYKVLVKSLIFTKDNKRHHFCLFALKDEFEKALVQSEIIFDSFSFK